VQARHQYELQQELVMQKIWKQAIGAVSLSAMALGAFAPPALAVETGQLLDRGRWPRTVSVAETGQKITCPGPECTPEFVNDAVQRGVMTPKEAKQLRKIQSKPQARASGGANTLAIAGGLAAVVGIAVAVGGGSSKSP
jgi:hypothetical protein